MKRGFLLLMVTSVVFAQYSTNSRSLVNTSVKEMAMISSSITNKATYTTEAHAGIKLGILEYETVKAKLSFGYKRFSLKGQPEGYGGVYQRDAVNSISAPRIRVGAPNRIYFDFNYTINPITRTQLNKSGSSVDSYNKVKPLSKFGGYLIGQTPDGKVRFGAGGQLYLGRETWDYNASSRLLLGAENIGLMLGFNLHEAVNLSLSGHCSAYYDSLYYSDEWHKLDNIDNRYQERFAWLQLPQVDLAVDVGQHDLPYVGNMVVTYAKNHFVYNLKGLGDLWTEGLSSNEEDDIENGRIDPIKVDSLGFHVKNMWLVDLKDAGELRPALSFGLSQHWSKHMHAGEDNWPIAYDEQGDANQGWEHRIGGINWGAGLGYSAKEIVEAWAEYQMSTMSYSPAGDMLKDNGAERDTISPLIYSNVGIGLKTNFDKYPGVDMGDHTFAIVLGFLFREENAQFGTFRSWPLDYMYDLSLTNGVSSSGGILGAEKDRYQPWVRINRRYQTIVGNFGIGATFAKKTFELDAGVAFVNQKETNELDDLYEYKRIGVEFGIDFTYNLQGKREMATEKKVEKNPEEMPDNSGEQGSETPVEDSNGL